MESTYISIAYLTSTYTIILNSIKQFSSRLHYIRIYMYSSSEYQCKPSLNSLHYRPLFIIDVLHYRHFLHHRPLHIIDVLHYRRFFTLQMFFYIIDVFTLQTFYIIELFTLQTFYIIDIFTLQIFLHHRSFYVLDIFLDQRLCSAHKITLNASFLTGKEILK